MCNTNKPKQMQVGDYYNKRVAAEDRSAFLYAMAAWEDSTTFVVFHSFYDMDVLHTAHNEAQEK